MNRQPGMPRPLSHYRYTPRDRHYHRDIAHWRGARAGMRVLGLPSCAGWLQGLTGDDYDLWLDLAAAMPAIRAIPAAAPTQVGAGIGSAERPAAALAASGEAIFILHKEADGQWSCAPLPSGLASATRPCAANCGDLASEGEDVTAPPGNPPVFIIEMVARRA